MPISSPRNKGHPSPCWIPNTGSEVDADTPTMIPTTVPIPTFGDKEALEQALSDIMHIIKNPTKNNVPQYWKGDEVHAAFQTLATMIKQHHTGPTPVVFMPQSTIQPEIDIAPVPQLLLMPDLYNHNKVQQEPRVVAPRTSAIPEIPTTAQAPVAVQNVQPQPR
eukprot:5388605-Ditylum_brightwellii.AAC.1